MRNALATLLFLFSLLLSRAQEKPAVVAVSNVESDIAQLKETIRALQASELQSEKTKYMRSYQLVLYGMEIIKEIQQGAVEISGARSQNILYKKIIDINNPSSDALGFQLMDVIDKTLEENINALPLLDTEKKRLKGQVSGLIDGLKRTFPPLQIIGSAFSMISSFTTYKARMERLDRKTDSIVVEATYPISKEIITRINNQMAPYIEFYSQLNKINTTYESALYGHVIEYRDFIEEINYLKAAMENQLNINESIGEQVNTLFDLANSSREDFDFKKVNTSEQIRNLAGTCMSVFNLVERYKKFTSDFIAIQDDFYKENLNLLQEKAKKLPIRDDAKIDRLIAEMTTIKQGNTAQNIMGFDESYKSKVKSIATKLYALNKTRF